jgi:hypothetical protein
VALRPRHVDFLRRLLRVEETIVEVSKKYSPTGGRMIVKPHPKDNEPPTMRDSPALLEVLAAPIEDLGLSCGSLLFPSVERAGGAPMSATLSGQRCGSRLLSEPTLVSTFGRTTWGTLTHLGSSPAGQTSRPSEIA